MTAVRTEPRSEKPARDPRWVEFDVLLAESRLYLERARVHMARAKILDLEEQLEEERAGRSRMSLWRRS